MSFFGMIPTARRTLAFLPPAGLTLLFAILAVGLHGSPERAWDVSLLRLVHAASAPVLDALALRLSALGSSVGLALLASFLGLVLMAAGRRRDVVLLATAVAGIGPVVAALKAGFERPRPGLWQSIAPAPGFSFPSGHAAASVTLAAVVIAIAWPTRWRWLAVVVGPTFAFAVGLSRVYLGVHYPSDVLAGWCVGAAWTLGLLAVRRLVLRTEHVWSAARACR